MGAPLIRPRASHRLRRHSLGTDAHALAARRGNRPYRRPKARPWPLYAVAECELEPDELQDLTEQHGDLRWSTSTRNRYGDPLQIREISLTSDPATVGLWAVQWYKLNVTKGNPPMWVREDLDRVRRTEYRSRGELRVHEVGSPTATVDAAEEYEQLGRDLGMLPGGYDHRYLDPSTGEEVEVFCRPGRIIAVNGRRVRRQGRTA